MTSLANPSKGHVDSKDNTIWLKVGKFEETGIENGNEIKTEAAVLILGAGRVCRPAVEFLTSTSHKKWLSSYMKDDPKQKTSAHVIVASLFVKDAEEVSITY